MAAKTADVTNGHSIGISTFPFPDNTRFSRRQLYVEHKNAAKFYTGLIQLQNPEFSDTLSIDDVLPQTESFISSAKDNPNIDVVLPRVESFALAAKDEHSKGALVLGVDPEAEDDYSRISDKIVKGTYIAAGENSVLVGDVWPNTSI